MVLHKVYEEDNSEEKDSEISSSSFLFIVDLTMVFE